MEAIKSKPKALSGVVGFFDGPDALLEGMKKLKAAGFENIDAFSPFPIHGMDQAQGLRRSPLPYVTLFAGTIGFSLAFMLQSWTLGRDWKLVVGGKPFFSLPAWAPILFELTVLLGALTTVAAMFALNGLPNLKRKAFDPKITCDRFALFIGDGKSFVEAKAQEFLKSCGAHEVRTVYEEGWF